MPLRNSLRTCIRVSATRGAHHHRRHDHSVVPIFILAAAAAQLNVHYLSCMQACSRRASFLAFRFHQRHCLYSSKPPRRLTSKMSDEDANEGKVTATQADINARQEELDREMQDVSLCIQLKESPLFFGVLGKILRQATSLAGGT